MMKSKAESSQTEDQKAKLEREKKRIEKTITQLQQRLEYVEDALGNM